jgi:UDPglucose 6-dehydrogenase/GDP-mannose 6-dehydrogenase
MTRWDAFQRLPQLLKKNDRQPVVIDGRRMLNKNQLTRYDGIGL